MNRSIGFNFRELPSIQRFKEDILVLLKAIRINIKNIQSLTRALDSQFTDEEKLWIEDAAREFREVEMRGSSLIESYICDRFSPLKYCPLLEVLNHDFG